MRLPAAGQRPAALQCPHLGTESDPFSRRPQATDEHRCYAHLGRDRIDLSHQRRFCLTSAHAQCPFLLIDTSGQKRDWVAEARAGWRSVSPARPALSAAQLGEWLELGLAAARWTAAFAWQVALWVACASAQLLQLVLQTWHAVRPQKVPLVEAANAVETLGSVADPAAPEVVEETPSAFATPEVSDDRPTALATPEVSDDRPTAFATPDVSDDRPTALDWFWRAKNAETLDELIDCLTRACALDPENPMLTSNLALALDRRAAAREAEKAAKAARRAAGAVTHAPLQRRPSTATRLLRHVISTVRTAAALAAIVLAGALLLGALPAQLRTSLFSTAGLPESALPDLAEALAFVHIPLAGGYDAATALPYAIGFTVLFVGVGLLQPQTRP